MDEIDEYGGMTRRSPPVSRRCGIEESAARTQAPDRRRRRRWSGSTPTGPEQDTWVEVLKVDGDEVRRAQIAKLERLRGERNEDDVRQAL